MNKRLLIVAAIATSMMCLNAQVNSPDAAGYIDRAILMYDDGNYFGTLDQLSKINESWLDADALQCVRYYKAIATVHTDPSQAAVLLERYLADYPEALNRNVALYHLAECYYGHDYARALSIYEQIYPAGLPYDVAQALTYHKAYCFMMSEKYADALPLFESLGASAQYGNASRFYQGYIAYIQRQYPKAESIFRSVNTSRAPGNMADYYLAQIEYVKGDYGTALSLAKTVLNRKGTLSDSDTAGDFLAETYRIAGESSYQLGDDSNAVRYLSSYVELVEAPMPSALYILGLSAYRSGLYNDAIEYLTRVTANDDAMGQSAYLYVGLAYMHQGDYSGAAMAFNRALNMDYDPQVRETAYYNYAVASANGGKAPFASTVKICQDFLNLYPDSQYAPQVQEYIITTYLTENNYSAALQSINAMASPSAATSKAKQRILYVLGCQAASKGDYKQAETYLKEAESLAKYDSQIAAEVTLALGETYYGLGNYTLAVKSLNQYIKSAKKSGNVNLPLANYDLGYALFAQKKYSEAIAPFNNCCTSGSALSPTVLADAYSRLGDCYYHAKDFAKAEAAYDKAYNINTVTGDYALFQKALMAGFQRNYRQKIDLLERLQREFPLSAFLPDAMLESTESFIQLGNTARALQIYQTLVDQYPNTIQGRQGLLQMALVKYNTGDATGAKADYREVISRYPTSDEAHQAIEHMKRICAADGSLSEFTRFLASVANAPQIDANEIEQLTFDNAEQLYLSSGATKALEEFVVDYPGSSLRPRALSYLLTASDNSGNMSAAYDYANIIVDQYPSSKYIQQALTTKARVEESQGKGNLALRTWQQLLDVASTPEAKLSARMGIIYNGLGAKVYDDVLKAADAVLATANVGNEDMAAAQYARGCALMSQGDASAAREAWSAGSAYPNTLFGIQCMYALADSYFQAGDYAKAEALAKKVANAETAYVYWMARGFILLSDIYAAQGDTYKARQYLEAVRDNYEGSETDIFMMIDQRLK